MKEQEHHTDRAAAEQELLEALDALGESVAFCISGRRELVLPGLVVEGVGECTMPLQEETVQELLGRSSQAPYGRGERTIVDTEVRRAWQIEAAQLSFRNPAWQGLLEEVAREVQAGFGLRHRLHCELYKLLIYEEGCFFTSHRDSEKEDGMFATLVIALPSYHEGGELVIRHDGLEESIDFGGEEEAYALQFAAFYADCQHEIKPVRRGYRVCLVYNVSMPRRKRQPSVPKSAEQVSVVARSLSTLFEEEGLEKVAIPLKHQYTVAGLDPQALKGADWARLGVLSRAAQALNCSCYIALMAYRQEGIPDEGSTSYGWGWSYEEAYEDADFEEVYEEGGHLEHWFDVAGESVGFGKMTIELEELLGQDEAFEGFSWEQVAHEATGNEGVTLERWYRQAVAVLWPRAHHVAILVDKGQGVGMAGLREFIQASPNPAQDGDCLAFAQAILDGWRLPRYRWQKKTDETVQMLRLLYDLGDEELTDRFIQEILPRQHCGQEGELLVSVCEQHGWQRLSEALQHLFATPKWTDLHCSLGDLATIFADLVAARGREPEREELLRSLAEALFETIRRWDASGTERSRVQGPELRDVLLEAFFRGLSELGADALLSAFLDHLLPKTARYDLHTVLIPAARALHEGGEFVSRSHLKRLGEHIVRQLERRTAAPVSVPKNWTQRVKLDCSCEDCRELQDFLHDPDEQELRLPRRKEDRRHLHQVIDRSKCDLLHVTERRGRPYTLVCTKTRATYDAQCRQYEENLVLLAEIRALLRAEMGLYPPQKSKTARERRWEVGCSVKVQRGVHDPQDPTVDLSGWQGRIVSFEEGEEGQQLVELAWDSETLQSLPEAYIEESEEQGLDWSRMLLSRLEVSPCTARDTPSQAQQAKARIEARFCA